MDNENIVVKEKRGTQAISVPRSLRRAYLGIVLPYLLGSSVAIFLSALVWFYSVINAAQLGSRFYAKILPQVLTSSIVLLLFLSAVLLLVLFLIANELARRISGQVYRLERDMQKVKDGSVDSIKLREGDELARIAQTFNGVVDTIRIKARTDQ